MDPIQPSSTAARSPLLELPFEILVMILQYYFTVLMSERDHGLVNSRFGIRLHAFSERLSTMYYTEHPPHKHTVRGYYLKRVGALYASRILWKAAQLAAAEIFHGSLVFSVMYDSHWEWPSKKDKFYRELSPKIPLYLIREVTFDCGKADDGDQDIDMVYKQFTWRELKDFFVFERWPVLQKVIMWMHTLNPQQFSVRQIGDLLRGKHDRSLVDCWTPYLPEMSPDDPRELRLHRADLESDQTKDDRAIVVELYIREPVGSWVSDWQSFFGGYMHEVYLTFILRGKNFEELEWVGRECWAPAVMQYNFSDTSSESAESDDPGEENEPNEQAEEGLSNGSGGNKEAIEITPAMHANGVDWEEKAIERWPVLKGALGKRIAA